jgi:hypothetical protein
MIYRAFSVLAADLIAFKDGLGWPPTGGRFELGSPANLYWLCSRGHRNRS